MTLLQRRRALMMAQQQAAPEPSGTPITGFGWTVGQLISSSGAQGSAKYAATSNSIQRQSGVTKVKYTGATAYDGATLNIFVHEYQGSVWKRRLGNLNSGAEFALDASTTQIRFTFAFGSSSGKTMTQAIVDQCFAAEWVE